nr:TraM recognition domain-containing protein [Microbacterium immunditiarum]
MDPDRILPRVGLAAAAAVLLVLAGTNVLVQLATRVACGAPPSLDSLFSGVWLILTGDASGYDPAPGCGIPVAALRVLGIVLLVVLIGGVTVGVVWWGRYRRSDRAFVRDLHRRAGFASAGEVTAHLSRKAVLRRGPQLRPGLQRPQPTDVGWRVGRSRGVNVLVSIEDSVAVVGPPRSGKGYRVLISAILDWAGPLVTTSTTNDNLTATLRMRQQRGDVLVFDPQGISGIRDTLRIDPIAGCEDPLVATQRGTAIVTGTALGTSSHNQEWAQVASTVLARLLHAAAVSGRTVSDLYQWGSNPALARSAVGILRTDGAAGWGDGLDAILAGDEKLLSSTWFGVQAAVAPLAIPQIRDALQPGPGDRFDPAEFLTGQNTLYLLGSGAGAGAMGGFLGALLDDVVEVARRTALASPGARLGLPLGLILDEIANLFRWAALPRVMADGGGRGICTFVVLQALSQAETAWSKAEADTIWAAATAKVLLGGASNVSHLRDIESLLGSRTRARTQRSWSSRDGGSSTTVQEDRVPLLSIDELRRMPPTLGLLAYRNRRSVLLDLDGWDQRRDARMIRGGKAATEREQQAVFAARYAPPPAPPEEEGE